MLIKRETLKEWVDLINILFKLNSLEGLAPMIEKGII